MFCLLGYGKSVVFQAVPRYIEDMSKDVSNPLLIVFSPLVALMKDQIKIAGESSIMAICLDKDVSDESYEGMYL